MSFDPIKQFLQVDESEDVNALDVVTGNIDAPAPAITGLGGSVAAGAAAGAEGMASDVEYFKGLLNIAVGDEEAAAQNIRLAQQDEQAAARATTGIDSFEEFYNEPTVEGFISQVGKLSGQTVPFALTSIAGGGLGGLVGRQVGKKVSKKAAERLVQDSVERTAKGVATPDERLIAQAAYDYAKRGAYTGAFAAEYVPATAGSARESLESGRELDTNEAFRAFLVGAPVAAVGVAGEAAILKAVGNVAKSRAVKEGSTFAQLAKDIATTTGRVAGTEALTETVQEGLSVLNRASMDDSFTAQDAAMRLGEAAFAGFFAGAGLGAAGGVAGSVVSNREAIANSAPVTAVAGVVDKARRFLDQAQSQQVNSEINSEQYGDIMSGNTTPESQADINAQLNAMVDDTSAKEAVWVAGNEPQFSARESRSTEIVVDGKLAYAAFIPGRGTIVSTNRNVVNQVIAEQASDTVLAAALGYSSAKDATSPGDTVVQVVDKDGGIVSEEVTDSNGLPEAFNAAQALMPEGGSVKQTTVEKALEERNKRATRERGPTVRSMEEDVDPITGDPISLDENTVSMFDGDTQGEFQSEVIESTDYQPRNTSRDAEGGFANTQEARDAFIEAFGDEMDIDFNLPFYSNMSESFLRKAVQLKQANPTEFVSVTINPDLTYKLRLESTPETETVTIQDNRTLQTESVTTPEGESIQVPAIRRKVPIAKFIYDTIQKARKSLFAYGGAVLVTPDGESIPVNIADLTNAGKRLAETRDRAGFQEGGPVQAARRGLLAILSEFGARGYDLRINGVSVFADEAALRESTIVVDTTGKTEIKANQLFAREAETETRTPRTRETDTLTPLDRPEQLADQGSEIDVMRESLPEDTSGIDRRVGVAAPYTGAEPPKQMQFADSTVVSFINNLINALRLRTNLRVYNIDQLLAASDSQLRSLFASVSDYEKVSQSIRDFRERPKLFGRAINGLDGGSIIILREQANPLRTALTAGHELGHVLFAEHKSDALDSRTLRASLLRTYKKDKLYQNYVNKYGEELGFDEWYADQVAKWASRRYIRQQAKSLSDRHFKQLVDKIRGLYRSLGRIYRQRLTGKVDQQFDQFMDAVLEARRDGKTVGETSFAKKQLAREMERAVVKEGGEALAAHWKKKISDIVNDPNVRPLLKFVRTADGVLRGITGSKVADMFYVRSQDKEGGGDLGFIGAKARKIDDLQNKFERDVGSLSDETTVAAIEEAASSAPTASLSPEAQKVRKFLDDIYVDYIEPSNTNVGRQGDYFPTALELMEVVERGDDFISLVVAYNPGITPARAREAVNRLREFNHSMQDDGPVEFNVTNPASSVEEARQLTANVPREILQEQGFLQDPREALISYVRHIATRVEWNAHTKDNDGVDILGPELDKLSERDREEANGVIAAYLGYQSKPIGPVWRKVNSYGQFFQFVTILPFATLASLPELAGPLINSKELDFNTFVTAFKEIGASIKNRAESQQFARDIGVVTSEVVANSWVTEAEQDFMDPKVRKMSDWYFKAIGLNWYTKFTREFAAGMGVQFIIRHAENKFDNPRSERYLSELGLTAEDVKKWDRSNRRLDTPEGKKVTKALQRFVESSVLRPNAAERPIWASDPRWALIWQLKSFMYAYQKVIVGGVFREMQNRTREGTGTGMAQLTSTTAVLALTAIATMPLAMLALELREYAKYGLAAIIPGADATDRYFRSDRMDWGEYFVEIFDRSGFTGAFAIAGMMNQNAEWGQNPLLPLAGPTAETVDKLIDNGFDVTKTIGSRLPISFN